MPQSDIFGHVQRQRGFSHGRARGEDDELGGLQAGGLIVQIRVAGGQTGDPAAFAENFLKALETLLDQVFDIDQAGLHAVFGQLQDGRFGAIENHIGIVASGQRLLLNGRRGIDQAAQHRFFLHDARVVIDVGHARQTVGKRRKIGHAARGFQFPAAAQILH